MDLCISEAAGRKLTGSKIFSYFREYQGNGYGSHAIALVEAEIKKYSESVYLEVAARNFGAMKLYHRLGYHCLNTVTLRKDFQPENFEVIRSEELLGYPLEVKKYIK